MLPVVSGCLEEAGTWKKRGHNKRSLWEKMRNLFDAFVFASMQELYEAIINGFARQQVVLLDSS